MNRDVVEHVLFNAWAVQITMCKVTGKKAWAGRYYFDQKPQPSHEGCQTALFETRALAREAAKKVHEVHQPACAVAVKVFISRRG